MSSTVNPKLNNFLLENDELARKWKKSPSERVEIGKRLFEINRNIFKKWKLFDEDAQQDYMQDAYLYMIRALEYYTPGKGAFVNVLKWYVQKLRKNYFTPSKELEFEEETTETDQDDHLFWEQIKNSCSPKEWQVFHKRFFEGCTCRQIASQLEMHEKTVQKLVKRARARINTETLKEKVQESLPFEWLTVKQLAQRSPWSVNFIRNILAPTRPLRVCRYKIHAEDAQKMPGCHGWRIKYKMGSRGIMFPRLKDRPGAGPKINVIEMGSL